MGSKGEEFDVKVKPRFYETAKHKRSYRCLVLHQLNRIADNTEEIKKLISKEKEPFDVDKFIEGFKKGLEACVKDSAPTDNKVDII